MSESSWLPLVFSVAGALIAGLTALLLAVLAWLGKFTLETLRKQIETAASVAKSAEDKANKHETAIATSDARAQADALALRDLKSDVTELSNKVDHVSAGITEIRTILKRHTTPPRPIPRIP